MDGKDRIMKRVVGVVLLLLMATTGMAQELKLDTKKASVSFVFVSENLNGTVGGVQTTIKLNFSDLSHSSISGTADVSTLSTENKMRDKHLKSDDFFDAENYPQMRFESTELKKSGETYSAKGTLTIHGVSKEVEFVIETTDANLLLRTSINADDFGVSPKNHDKSQVDITVTVPLQ